MTTDEQRPQDNNGENEAAFNIREELAKLPSKPGVYIMRDRNDEIIYVGKAVSLRNRVRQYFQSSRGKSLKITSMVGHIDRFEYIVTDSELEALVLENNLIKENDPKYNTMLKDDKTYPFIKVTLGEEYPRVVLVRRISKDRSKYYGPYSDVTAVRNTIDLVRKLFGIRGCSKKIPFKDGNRACLYYHLGECPAPCTGGISKEEYRKNVERAVSFLNGNHKDEIRLLTEKMQQASEDMDFEKAIEYRDMIRSIESVGQRQKITGHDTEDRDIAAMAREGTDAVAQIFFVRSGKIVGREHYYIRAAEDDEDSKVFESFLKQHYAGTPFIPPEIIAQYDFDDRLLMEDLLSENKGQKVRIQVPKRGVKEKLLDMAYENASMILNRNRERIRGEEKRTKGAACEIARALNVKSAERIEAYDISNISGFQSVGSMVVFENGRPKRSDYRKFRIRSVNGPDDYGSMREVLGRRFKRAAEGSAGFEKYPDLILMDGGAGQVNTALKVLAELGVDVNVCGMVKDDRHRTRALLFNDAEVPLEKDSEGFRLVTRIQDEAHRFAIEYHRLLRTKGQVHSVLDDIPGIGPARRKALMGAFSTLEEIRNASVSELAAIPSMNMKSAESVRHFFEGEDDREDGK